MLLRMLIMSSLRVKRIIKSQKQTVITSRWSASAENLTAPPILPTEVVFLILEWQWQGYYRTRSSNVIVCINN